MRVALLLFLLSGFSVLGQKVYLSHEVEKQVEPSGGLSLLNQFVQENQQIPFRSAVKGLNGRVYVKGIVEPDGSMSAFEVAKGIDSLCNQEAIRIMGLYKAWKPAILKGEKVRQYFVYPVVFKAEPMHNYDSTSSRFVDYFDKKFYLTTDPSQFEYRVFRSVDPQGYIGGDVISEQKNGKKWSRIGTVPFKRTEIWHRMTFAGSGKDSVSAYELAARDENLTSYASEAVFQKNGKLLAHKEYGGDNKMVRKSEYDLNGLLRSLHISADSANTVLLWYDNGQLQSVVEYSLRKNTDGDGPMFINSWERDGVQKVKDGNGLWSEKQWEKSGEMSVEEGMVVEGRKDGKWVSKLESGKMKYEELYQNDKLLKGTSYEDGIERTYDQEIIQPYFKNGINNYYKFLGQNIRYPIEASRRRVGGRAYVSFVVCEDGSLCDYKVEKRVGFGIDEEALRVVKKMDGMWEPGVMRGKKVRVKYNLAINFQLE